MEKLKPCPCCGDGDIDRVYSVEYDNGPPYCRCDVGCGCGMSAVGYGNSDEEAYNDAVSTWNRRADTVKTARCVVAADGSATCSECGMPFVMTGARFCPMCGARLLDLIVTSEAPDGTETVKVITEEQIRKSCEAFESGQKTVFIPRIKIAGDDGEDVM